MSVEELLAARLRSAFAQVAGSPVDPAVRRSQHADYQADGALALARELGRAPREVAAEVVARADLDGLAELEVVGPGFINITVQTSALHSLLLQVYADSRLGVPQVASPQAVLVDYSGPNVAKEMHVGHLRSTVIGDAIVRLLEFEGHRVTRVNHLGDWGTPFGMLIEHLLDIGEQEAAHELSVGDLTGFYQAARRKFDGDPDFKRRAQLRVVALQSGDETTGRLWRLLVDESEKYFLSVYSTLDVTLGAADFLGESAYNDELADVVGELSALGLLTESDGALCAFPAGFTGRDGAPMPVIVRKEDGGYNYSATDLAALRRRCRAYDRAVYVVGTPQKQHFAMVFAVGADAGWVRPGQVEHVAFGSILGADGKMLKTRAGDSIKLSTLLDEAVARAAALAPTEDVAHFVGIGAVKYADLSSDRVKDYVFDWDRALSLTGDSGAYLQYAYARIQSLLTKGGSFAPGFSLKSPGFSLESPVERALALHLLGFPAAVSSAASTLQPHRLAGYLHGLATAYSVFYEKCPVLRAPTAEIRDGRLGLADLTGRVLTLGLSLLGIRTPTPL
ncbi:MAG: arginine--tRNA ligase [Hamadaea sp.]|uniref:arginine--tRNA ligase n=1 Tax=Hamadaea sp. TaxID=2024425 RepID=UPI001844C90F|nr:arginine--tRNA ligase [Hamadaea sp.]NUR73361.1 arginine--tRNA ligase [Hamadaea sp.]NUT21271.1 arginine--tRNA ligase [Hamadaea sp.]